MEPGGKTFIVTGAASGLGRASAEALARAKARVVCVDVSDDGRETARAIGNGAKFIRADVMSEVDVAQAVAGARGGLAGVVNCAGTAIAERLVGRNGPHALDAFARVIAINLVGTFNVIRLAAAAIAERDPDEHGERGVIVNTASIAAFDG